MATSQEFQVTTRKWAGELGSVEGAKWPRLNAHHRAWVSSITKGLKHTAYLVEAKTSTELLGVLPLCFVSGPIFGKFLVSLPYVNTGGVWARDHDVASQMIDAACDLADQLNVKHLELRHEIAVPHPRLNFERIDKVHMRLALPEVPEGVVAALKSKVRSQVKRSNQFGLTLEFGGTEFLSEFYNIFAVNMRDLGTPVFSKKLFGNILESFGDKAEFCLVRSEGTPAASGLLVHSEGITEVPSASCLRKFNRMNANMFMYQHLLERAVERGSHTFDFGRSSVGSGTYKFKSQWRSEAHPAAWQYYVRKGNPEDLRPDAEGKQRLVEIWKKLPVWLTKIIGPFIVRGIP